MSLDIHHVQGPAGSVEVKVARPPSSHATGRLIVLTHGLPLNRGGGKLASRLLPELAERIAGECGWIAAVPSLRSVGETDGTFSAQGWLADLRAVIDDLAEVSTSPSLAGFGLGGALCLNLAANDERIRGVVTLATPADLGAWCGPVDQFSAACERAGVVPNAAAVSSEELVAEVIALDPLGSISRIPPRHLMIVHGSDDAVVPATEARALVEAAEGHAELRIIQGAGHWLRADPRMVATLLGWLDRRS